jgi:hypothetical protein
MSNELKALNDLNESLKELSKYAKAFSDLVSIMAQLGEYQSMQWKFFIEFNKFVLYLNQKNNTNFRMFDAEESCCESIFYFNSVVDYINEKHNKQIPYVVLETSYDEAFYILESMKEAVEKVDDK